MIVFDYKMLFKRSGLYWVINLSVLPAVIIVWPPTAVVGDPWFKLEITSIFVLAPDDEEPPKFARLFNPEINCKLAASELMTFWLRNPPVLEEEDEEDVDTVDDEDDAELCCEVEGNLSPDPSKF